MNDRTIILAPVIFFVASIFSGALHPALAAPPLSSLYPATVAQQPVIVSPAQPYVPAAPGAIAPGQPIPMGATYPQPGTVPGAVMLAPPTTTVPGTYESQQFVTPTLPPGAIPPGAVPYGASPIVPATIATPQLAGPPLGPNPIAVRVTNDEVAWDQIADVVADYFTIAREERARREGDVMIEGRIDTVPLDGATWLQPWRKDSVGTFNRWESTFQTIRRRATLRVIPDTAGYLVEVIVEKELEDLPNPEKATAAGSAVFLNDDALPSQRLEDVSRTASSSRWLQLGRDPLLEQRMLGDIQARLGGVR